jgi:DNA-binding HxlR family transcriptional regulator
MRFDNAALDDAVRRVGDRWTLRIVAALLDGDRTFGELTEDVAGIAPNILTARLRTLERDRLIAARPYQHHPVRMRYQLTVPGRRLADTVALLAGWGARRSGASPARHEVCGAALEVRPWCPTCETVVEPGRADELVWV